jgi:hypothetical protein
MIKSNASGIPGMSAMTDTLDFVKNLWGGMSLPGMGIPGVVMPTLSVDEINKQISDLRAVESWLTLNMNMLRGTIQALEVQALTISTLKSMGESLSAAVQTSTEAVRPQEKPQASPQEAPKPVAEKASQPEPEAETETDPSAEAKPKTKSKEEPSNLMTPQTNPAVWWNMLQDQFKKAVSVAMQSDNAKPPAKSASTSAPAKTTAKPKKKPAAGKPKPAARSAPKPVRKA